MSNYFTTSTPEKSAVIRSELLASIFYDLRVYESTSLTRMGLVNYFPAIKEDEFDNSISFEYSLLHKKVPMEYFQSIFGL